MFKFIENIGDYFSTNFFDEDFKSSVFNKSGYSQDDLKEMEKMGTRLKDRYFRYKSEFLGLKRPKDKILATHNFHTELLTLLEFDGARNEYDNLYPINEKHVIPVRHKYFKGNKPQLFIMEMQSMIQEGDEIPQGLFDQRYCEEDNEPNGKPQIYHRSQWEYVFKIPENLIISPSIINEAISEIFLLEQHFRPEYIVLLAGNEIYLLQSDKWFKGSYLRFNIEHLFDEASIHREYYALFYLLLGKKMVSPDSDLVLLEKLDEESHKRAYAVTEDLKTGIINAIEDLANEAVFYFNSNKICEEEMRKADFAEKIKDDCLTIIYRMLFVFYAESRSDLEILPIDDEVYEKGYSLEMLRDLEQVPLNSPTARDGYFFHDSLLQLFKLLNTGYKTNSDNNKSFEVIRLDTPLFDNNKLHLINKARFRNIVWQNIICELSLSQKKRGKARGRISYANLGINQLGSVYEGLLSYRGFFAEQDYIEVKKADDPTGKEGTWVVPRIRRGDFEEAEIVKNPDDEHTDLIIEKGKFIYRLSGRDRQKSASYYTPEVLTRTTVKYTLKPILERLDNGEIKASDLLDLKILEPAMGAAAFHNEVINQVATEYLEHRQVELKTKVSPGKYQEELQKVKAYIATNNVYGVDLNPTAIELGKLSLWLNVIHKSMETPFFGYRLGVGNAVVGAWLKVYKSSDISLEYEDSKRKKIKKKEWWTFAPAELKFKLDKSINRKDNEIYNFLLPDKNMAPSAGINLLKEGYPVEARNVGEWRTQFCKPFSGDEIVTLKRFSEKIDQLLEEHYQFNKVINGFSQDKSSLWGKEPLQTTLHSYSEKELLAQQRDKNASPYFKLKTIMDYWCALWFWDVRDAAELPTREDYLKDISIILEIDLDIFDKEPIDEWIKENQPKQINLFPESKQLKLKQFQQQKQQTLTIDAIQQYANRNEIIGNRRIELIKQYSIRYKYFHYQLEFIEVFKDRGGFDVIVGNPPWVKITFKEKEVIGEIYPEIELRSIKTPILKSKRESFLNIPENRKTYYSVLLEIESASTFMGGHQNYPLLVKQQTDLYKCIIENSFRLICLDGCFGLIHPESIYEDSKGDPFRREIYKRLRFHFQFQNQLFLFNEVGDRKTFGINIYGKNDKVHFYSMNNLFHPSTIEPSFLHIGKEVCGGIKVRNSSNAFEWNVSPHKDRIIEYNENELRKLPNSLGIKSNWEGIELVVAQTKAALNVFNKIGSFWQKVANKEYYPTMCFDETGAQKDKITFRKTLFPKIDDLQLILSGPHFYVSNPLYKTPKNICTEKSHYDVICYTDINNDFVPRTNYIPLIDKKELIKLLGYPFLNTSWLNFYKVCFSRRLNQQAERTLQPSLISPNITHVNTIISLVFIKDEDSIELTGLSSSIVYDFFIKTTGRTDLYEDSIKNLPIGIKTLKKQLLIRTLLLNSVNKYYAPLWQKNWDDEYKSDSWSKIDKRLKPFNNLTMEWQSSTPLRNWFERRFALIEIDVIVAIELGLTLEELTLIYSVQFPVLQQNEYDTWYDQNGNIVFTCSKGLIGIGLDRTDWERVKKNKQGDIVKHTVTKSELYRGKEITYYPPFEMCDRVEDYKEAWSHFEELAKKNKK